MSDAKEWYGVYLKCAEYEVTCCRYKVREENLKLAWKELCYLLAEFGFNSPPTEHFFKLWGGELKYFNPREL